MTPFPASPDSGGIVVGWLAKIVLVMAILGVLLYDIVAISYGRVAASDDARSIAQVATEALVVNHAPAKNALILAEQQADSRGVAVGKGDIVIAKNGAVTVRVHRSVATLITHHIGPLAQYSEIVEVYSTPPLTG